MKTEIFLSNCLMLSVADRVWLTDKEVSQHREPRYAAFISTYLTFAIAMSKHLANAEWRANSGSSAALRRRLVLDMHSFIDAFF